MQRDMIQRDLIQFDMEVVDQQEFFTKSVELLQAKGYVRPTYLEALVAREAKFPTALPTQPEAIAIPHADPQHINEPFIAAARLAAPVQWGEMGNSDNTLPVRFVFVLGFTRSDGHVKLLQVLLNNLQDPAFMAALNGATTADEYFVAVSQMKGLED